MFRGLRSNSKRILLVALILSLSLTLAGTMTLAQGEPVINLSSPQENLQTSENTVKIEGNVESVDTLSINRVPVTIATNGTFSQTVYLKEGTNTITVIGKNATGATTTVTRTVVYTKTPPVVTVSSPADNFRTNKRSVAVNGQLEKGTILTINGVPVTLSADGTYSQDVQLDMETNLIEVTGYNSAGLSSTVTRTVVFDNIPPIVGGVEHGKHYPNGTTLNPTFTEGTGTLNGLPFTSGSSITAKGKYTLIVTDAAGNQTTVEFYIDPILNIDSPADNIITEQTTIRVSGTSEGSVTVNGAPVQYYYECDTFYKDVALQPGKNVITITATDSQGNQAVVTRTVTSVIARVTAPVNNLLTNQGTVTVTGIAPVDAVVTVNGQAVTVDATGAFSKAVTLIPGSNTVTVVGTDKTGLSTTVTRVVNFDNLAPVLTITGPADNLVTESTSVTVTGYANEGTVLVNGQNVTYYYESDDFYKSVSLAPGKNTITIKATDAAGNQTVVTRTVTSVIASVSAPVNNLLTNQGTVTVTGKAPVDAVVTVNGEAVTVDATGTYSKIITLTPGSNTITVVGTDKNGVSTTVTRVVNYDNVAPVLTITGPADNLVTESTSVTVTGYANEGTVLVNGQNVQYGYESDDFYKSVSLAPGKNTITIKATDGAGNQTVKTLTVTSVVASVSAPTNNLLTNQGTVTVTGKAPVDAVVTVNGVAVTVDATGTYSKIITLTPGSNTITVVGTDKNGVSTTVTRVVNYDNVAPVLTITGPADNLVTESTSVTVTGYANEGTVLVNGQNVQYGYESDDFYKSVSLAPGKNTITIKATDGAGNQTVKTLTVTSVVASVSAPTNNLVTNQGTVTVTGKAPVDAVVTVNGEAVTVDATGTYSKIITLAPGNNTITVVGTDNNGVSTTVTRVVNYDNVAPVLTIDSPNDNLVTSASTIRVTGTASEGTVTVNGASVDYYYESDTFYKDITLSPGLNVITITAIDAAGNKTTVIRNVTKA